MGLRIEPQPGQTPLEEEEREGLKIVSILEHGELDEFEQKNIEQAILWTIGRKMKSEMILTESFVCELHKRMYGEVWAWAGKFRTSEKNLGIQSWRIATELRTLLDDVKFWIENQSFPEDEIAIRFKHRIVSIHCFPNGNGRHSRLMADLIAEKIFRRAVFSWGQSPTGLSKQSHPRNAYLKALKKADKGYFSELITFARM